MTNIVHQTENSIHESIGSGPLIKASIFSGTPFYKDNPKNNAEPWKESDPTSIIDNKTELIYDRLPIEVTIFKDKRIGYQIRCKKTGGIKRVTLLKIGDIDVSRADLGKTNVLQTFKFTPEFQVSESGVRLWKNIEKDGPQSFEWLIEDDGMGDLKFREEPEAFDSETLDKVHVNVSKTILDGTTYLFKENLKAPLEASKGGLKVDTDFALLSNQTSVYGTSATYATARSTSTAYGTAEVGQIATGGPSYTCYRHFLSFNTAALGGTSITAASMWLSCLADHSTTDFNVEIMKHDWSAQDPISNANREAAYDGCLAADKDVTWRNTSGMSLNTLYESPSLDIEHISKAGNTYYSLISSRDVAGTTPTTDERITIYPYTPSALRPKLSVTYYFSSAIIIF